MLIKDWYHLESNHDKQNPDKALVMMNRMNRIQDVDGFCPSTHSQPSNALLKSGSNFFSRCNFRPLCLRGGSGVAACRNVEVHCINMRKQPHVFTHRQIDVLEFQTCMAGVLHFRCETYLPGQLCHGLILTQAKISHKQQVLKYLARVRPLIASNIVKDQKKRLEPWSQINLKPHSTSKQWKDARSFNTI